MSNSLSEVAEGYVVVVLLWLCFFLLQIVTGGLFFLFSLHVFFCNICIAARRGDWIAYEGTVVVVSAEPGGAYSQSVIFFCPCSVLPFVECSQKNHS